jgi:fructose-bisphosphate aldolase class II
MLVNLNKVLPLARKKKYAIGAFNINNLEMAQGVIFAAEKLKAPVILQTSEGALEYAGLEYLAAIGHVAAELNKKLPVVLHLDHGKDEALVERVIKSGWYSSVMIDASRYPFEKNISVTRKIVELAHARGMSVEAELGAIAGQEDLVNVSEKEKTFTDPDQVKKFVALTKCDALAVSIGTAHGSVKYALGEKPALDLVRLKKIAAATSLPLILHGASSVPHDLIVELHKSCSIVGDCDRIHNAVGIPEGQVKKAIALGISKVNVDTDIRIAFTSAVREKLLTDANFIDPRKLLGPAREAVEKLVEKKIKSFGWK